MPTATAALHDPALPALGLLLDPHEAAGLLAAALDGQATVRAVRPTQVRHDRGRRVLVRYAVEVTWADGRDRVETLVAQHGGSPPEGVSVLTADDLGAAEVSVWRYPFDPYLPGLPSATHVAPVRALLRDLGLPAAPLRIRPRTYRPSRRAVLEVIGGADAHGDQPAGGADVRCYLKVVRPSRFGRIHAGHLALDGVVPVPAVLAAAADQGVLVLAAVPGDTLRQRLLGGGGLPDPAAVVALQRRMADATTGAAPRAARSPDISRHAQVLGGLLPQQVHRIQHVAAVAEEACGPADAVVHGDLHEAQLVVAADGGLTLLDLDGAGLGSVVDDCATMLAHLHVLAQWRPAAAAVIDSWARGYVEACAVLVDPALLRRRAAGVLLGLAAGGLAAQDAGWQATARQRLDLAVDLAGGDPPRRRAPGVGSG